MGKLDQGKPYGTVCGKADHTYEQDGKRFDGMGVEIRDDTPETKQVFSVPAEKPPVRGRPPKNDK